MKIGITERGDAGLDESWRDNLAQVDGAILITKAPQNLYLIPDNCIVHCTITGYGGTVLEPNVTNPVVALEAAYRLVDALGPDRVVLRIDPIIPTPKGLERAKYVLDRDWWGRIRVSFLDAYPHVRERFRAKGLTIPWEGLHAPLETRQWALSELKQIYEDIEICGEPGLDCTGCVSTRDLKTLGLEGGTGKSQQRLACACLGQKTELLTSKHPCGHGCLYCYWR